MVDTIIGRAGFAIEVVDEKKAGRQIRAFNNSARGIMRQFQSDVAKARSETEGFTVALVDMAKGLDGVLGGIQAYSAASAAARSEVRALAAETRQLAKDLNSVRPPPDVSPGGTIRVEKDEGGGGFQSTAILIAAATAAFLRYRKEIATIILQTRAAFNEINRIYQTTTSNVGRMTAATRTAYRQASDAAVSFKNRVQTSFEEMKNSSRDLEQRIGGFSAKVITAFNQIRLIGLGILLGSVVGNNLDTLRKYSQQIATLRAVTGTTREEIKSLEAEIRRLGGSTIFTATEAAAAATELARLGLSAKDTEAALDGVLRLAQVGDIDVSSAAKVTGQILNAFKEDADQTLRIADVLSKAANISAAGVTDIGDAMKFAAPAAAALGISLEDTTAALAVLSSIGLGGELGGTGLRTGLIRLEAGGESVTKVLTKFGLSVEDVKVSVRGLVPVLKTLQQAGLGVDDFAELLDVRAGPAFDGLTRSVADVERFGGELENVTGYSLEAAEVMDDNLNGAIKNMSSALEELVLKLGDLGANLAVRTAVDALAGAFRLAGENAAFIFATALAVSVRGIALMSVGLATLGGRVVAATSGLIALAKAHGVYNAIAATTNSTIGFIGRNLAYLPLAIITASVYALAAGFTIAQRKATLLDRSMQKFDTTVIQLAKAQSEQVSLSRALNTAYDNLSEAMDKQDTTAQALARNEIVAIGQRISANERLQTTYKNTLTAAEAQARAGSTALPLDFFGDKGRIRDQLGEIRQEAIKAVESRQGNPGLFSQIKRNVDAGEEDEVFAEMVAIAKRRGDEINAQLEKNGAEAASILTKNQIAEIAAINEIERRRKALGDLTTQLQEAYSGEKIKLIDTEGLEQVQKRMLELSEQIEIVQSSGNLTRVRALKEEQAILVKTAELINKGYSAPAAEQSARALAEGAKNPTLDNQRNEVFQAERQLAQARKASDVEAVKFYEKRYRVASETLKLLKEGYDIEVAQRVAEGRFAEDKDAIRLRQLKAEAAVREAQASGDVARVRELTRLADIAERQNSYEQAGLGAAEARLYAERDVNNELAIRERTLRSAAEQESIQHQISLAQYANDIKRTESLERRLEIERVAEDFAAQGLTLAEARAKAESRVNEEFEARSAARREELSEQIAQKDVEIAISVARRKGNDEQAKALEYQLAVRQRTLELERAGIEAVAAKARAESEVRAETPTKAEEVGASVGSSVSEALSDAARDGEWGNVVGDVFRKQASKGLEDAINDVSKSVGDFFTNLIQGKAGTIGLPGFGFKIPGIVDTATEGALKSLGDNAGGAAEGAKKAAGVLSGALTIGATQSAAAAVTETTASNAATTAMATLAASANTAALALARITAGGGEEGGGQQELVRGLLASFGRGFSASALTGVSGATASLGSRLSRTASDAARNLVIEVKGARGNAEIQQMVTAGVSEGVKISRKGAGPNALDWQVRFG